MDPFLQKKDQQQAERKIFSSVAHYPKGAFVLSTAALLDAEVSFAMWCSAGETIARLFACWWVDQAE